MHRKGEPQRPAPCANCTGHDDASAGEKKSDGGRRVLPASISTIDALGCHCTTVSHASMDEAVLTSSGPTFNAPVFAVVPPQLLVLLPRLVGEPVFKIGSSPPFMADKSHHTYLHTASLLI